jgi:spermidine/putrescine transport system substrate-binding protein
MTQKQEITRILASTGATHRLSRRSFLLGSAVSLIGGGVLLSGCGTKASTVATGTQTPGPIEGQFNMYNWAQYDDPNLIKAFTKAKGPIVQIDTYSSNEEMVAK